MSASLGHVWPKVSDSEQLVTLKEYKRLKKIATEGILVKFENSLEKNMCDS